LNTLPNELPVPMYNLKPNPLFDATLEAHEWVSVSTEHRKRTTKARRMIRTMVVQSGNNVCR
jgi:hypothetical protein